MTTHDEHGVPGDQPKNPHLERRLHELDAPRNPDESTKERILRVSAQLFAAKGFHGTGLTELSEAIGLGRGGLYHHIHSKDQLHAEIAFAPIRAAVGEAGRIIESSRSPVQKMEDLSLALAAAIRDSMNEWIVFFREFSSLPPKDQAGILELRVRYLDCWRAVIADGVHDGFFNDEDPVFLDGLLPLFIYAHIWETNRESATPLAAGESLARFILRGLSNHSQP